MIIQSFLVYYVQSSKKKENNRWNSSPQNPTLLNDKSLNIRQTQNYSGRAKIPYKKPCHGQEYKCRSNKNHCNKSIHSPLLNCLEIPELQQTNRNAVDWCCQRLCVQVSLRHHKTQVCQINPRGVSSPLKSYLPTICPYQWLGSVLIAAIICASLGSPFSGTRDDFTLQRQIPSDQKDCCTNSSVNSCRSLLHKYLKCAQWVFKKFNSLAVQ